MSVIEPIVWSVSLGIVAYLIGAIPFGLLIAKSQGVDLRQAGSGNIGATNVFRCVGKGWGILTFALDMIKGFVAAFCLPLLIPQEALIAGIGLPLGIAAFVGHCWPIYLKFKGGKGISTGLGLLIGVAPLGAAYGLVAWVIIFLIGRWVSLASILAAITVAVCVIPLYGDMPIWYQAFLFLTTAAAVWKHRTNIVRLVHGQEHRFNFTQAQRTAAAQKEDSVCK